jgi:hypothetical protein
MSNFLKTAALTALIGLGALGAAPASAQSGVYLGLGGGHHGPSVGVWFGDNDHRRPRHGWNGGHGRPGWDGGYNRRGCSAQQALNKAERMGLRRARVVDVDRRSIEVRGRKWGERRTVEFARVPGCPVIR